MAKKVNKRGAALIICFMLITVLAILSTAILSASISENTFTKKYLESTQAFWLAEAGVNKALNTLRSNYGTTAVDNTALGVGGYSALIAANGDGTRTITAHGFVPFNSPFRQERILEVKMNKLSIVPPNFYDNALYSASNVTINGTSYDINGNVIYSGAIDGSTVNINGTIAHDTSVSPLAALSYDQLRTLSQAQGNYHNASDLNGPFPVSFWYNESAGIPNVVFLEGNLDLNGKTVVGGFFVAGGEVTYNATISGNVNVEGCIYTRGNFTINGGGNSLNVEGGVWTGTGATLNGNAKINYNTAYMQAIKNLGIDTNVQILSWKDTQNPYGL